MTTQPPDDPIRSIAVVGDGLEAAVAAAFLASALDPRAVRILLLDSAVRPRRECGTDWSYAHIPPRAMPFLEALGMTPRTLIAHASGGFSLGTLLCGLPGGRTGRIPFGPVGQNWLGCPSHLYWSRAAGQGAVPAYADLSIAGQAMRLGRFAPEGSGSLAREGDYRTGMTCDPPALAGLLVAKAIAAGVVRSSPLHEALRVGDRLDGIRTVDGNRVEADLYVDCTGGDARFEFTASDHAETAERIEAPDRPFATAEMDAQGWSIRTPLSPGRTLERRVSSATRPHLLAEPWRGNVLAIGRAAFAFPVTPALEWLLLQEQLEALVDLLPGADCLPAETARYNAQVREVAAQASDAAAILSALRSKDILLALEDESPSAVLRVRLFAERGRVTSEHQDVMRSAEWATLLLACGLMPARDDIFAEQVPLSRLTPVLQDLARRAEAAALRLPTYSHFIAKLTEQIHSGLRS